jgi:hypothetical protein
MTYTSQQSQSASSSTHPSTSSYSTSTPTPSETATSTHTHEPDLAAIRLQELNQFSQSPGGISTWAIAGGIVGIVMAATAFRLARRRAQSQKHTLSPQQINFQRNPLTSTRNPPVPRTPTTALQLLQQERIQVQPTAIRQTFKRAPMNQTVSPPLQPINPILQAARQGYTRPISGLDPRKDLQVFQATTVRNIRQGRPNVRISGVRKEHVML